MGIAGVFDQIGTPIDINVKAKTADNNGAEKEEPRRSPPSSKVEAGAYFKTKLERGLQLIPNGN